MKQEVIDYGYIPRDIAQCLNPRNYLPVSQQIEHLISMGRVGPEGFLVSLRAAHAEALFFTRTSSTPDVAIDQASNAAFYKQAIACRKLQKQICTMKIDDLLADQSRYLGLEQTLETDMLVSATKRWVLVYQSLDKPKRSLKLVS